MTAFDPTHYPELRNLFPELTSTEFEISILLALGVPKKTISDLRSCHYMTVDQLANSAKSKFELNSLISLITIIQVRLVLFVLRKCRVNQ